MTGKPPVEPPRRVNTAQWDRKAVFYATLRNVWPFSVILETENARVRSLLQSLPQKPMKLLDIATGAGNVLSLVPQTFHCIACDVSAVMVRETGKRFHIPLVQCHSDHIPFKNTSFDIVTAVGILEYQTDCTSFLHTLSHLVGMGGFVLITLSPPGLFSFTRRLIGPPLSSLNPDTFPALAGKAHLTVVSRTSSLMQHQFLCIQTEKR